MIKRLEKFFSSKKFSEIQEICEESIRNLTKKNFIEMKQIQEKTFHKIYNGKSIIARDRTGSGKTIAFALPILEKIRKQKIFEQNKEGVVLVITPTRELARQIESQFRLLRNSENEFNISCFYGGIKPYIQERQFQNKQDVIIGTPGRLIQFLQENKLNLSQVQNLILDETDVMLDMGFEDQINQIIDKLKSNEQQFQTSLFSATIPPWVQKISNSLFNEQFEIVNLIKDEENYLPKNLDNRYIFCNNQEEKKQYLIQLIIELLYLNKESKILVFVNQKKTVKELQSEKQLHGIAPVFFSSLSQQRREVILNLYKQGGLRCLISTDVASRGLDIPNVDFVIHYDIPFQTNNFIHRSGRAGRNGMSGTNISLVQKDDMKIVSKYSKEANIKLEEMEDFNLETPELTYEAFVKKVDLQDTFYEARELLGPIKERLLEQYTQEELLDRMILKNMGLDSKFQIKHLPQDYQFFYVNHVDKNKKDCISKELGIPSRYIMDERGTKLIVFMNEGEVQEFKDKYIKGDFVMSNNIPIDLAKKQVLKSQFIQNAKMPNEFSDKKLILKQYTNHQLTEQDGNDLMRFLFKDSFEKKIQNWFIKNNNIHVQFNESIELLKFIVMSSSDKIQFSGFVFQMINQENPQNFKKFRKNLDQQLIKQLQNE